MEPSNAAGPVLVVDYGTQYAQLIARRVREAHVYSEIVPHTTTVADILARRPQAVILSGGPASVYANGAPNVDPDLLASGVPVLGICYGFQAMAAALGGRVERTGEAQFGRTEAAVDRDSPLFAKQPATQTVWMSHRDSVVEVPSGFTAVAATPGAPVAAFENRAARLYGVQWHPEVAHSEQGRLLLGAFLHDVAGAEPTWTTGSIIEESVKAVAQLVGTGRAICGLSGGVD
ncbi:MAG: glutamine-hydrolyzing GMP synthase, partial [Acidimicrobiales bacterium]